MRTDRDNDKYHFSFDNFQVAFLTIVAIHTGFWAYWFTHIADWMKRIRQEQGLPRS